ncbi:hypothetical protein MVEN_01156600 [Mycena venus]|uniref:CHAT domain-containing protein n=1 Tax=Mycena venus TaxID=2733690 RepID=A0A8H6Y4A7_9AGAR|nr:hypothetical protein MVEN_01156600 [Mycena venus]
MTALIQPVTPNASSLPETKEELRMIEKNVPKEWLTSLGGPDAPAATVEIALPHLRESSIVHFACHGTQDLENPVDTGLLLADGRLKLSKLMWNSSHQGQNMRMAFLSACETAKGDPTVPDEAMHLASTMLFLGFRGVVATMWTIKDYDGPTIVETFYRELFAGCNATAAPQSLPDLTKSARALHAAVTKLRADPKVPFHRWAPFVHYGL